MFMHSRNKCNSSLVNFPGQPKAFASVHHFGFKSAHMAIPAGGHNLFFVAEAKGICLFGCNKLKVPWKTTTYGLRMPFQCAVNFWHRIFVAEKPFHWKIKIIINLNGKWDEPILLSSPALSRKGCPDMKCNEWIRAEWALGNWTRSCRSFRSQTTKVPSEFALTSVSTPSVLEKKYNSENWLKK